MKGPLLDVADMGPRSPTESAESPRTVSRQPSEDLDAFSALENRVKSESRLTVTPPSSPVFHTPALLGDTVGRMLRQKGLADTPVERFKAQNTILSLAASQTDSPPALKELHMAVDNLGKIATRIQNEKINPDTYLEHLAHQVAYGDLEVGMLLPGKKPGEFYRVSHSFKNDEGLIAYGLESTEKSSPPILLFQGTNPKDPAHLHLDTDPDIGANAIQPDLIRLGRWLNEHKGATLTGHSLGGALAQQLAARHPESVGYVVTFCAPGVGIQTAQQFRNNQAGAKIKARHYVTQGDLVSNGGEAHLDGMIFQINREYPNSLAAHSASALLDAKEEDIVKGNMTQQNLSVGRTREESARRTFTSPLKSFIDQHVKPQDRRAEQEKTHQWLETIQSGRASPSLTTQDIHDMLSGLTKPA